jgi:uncharacterized membrane protein
LQAHVQAALDRRVVWGALALMTAAAAALRFPFLDHQGLWYDEAFTHAIVREPTVGGLWRHIQATESTPPLYYLLVWLEGSAGDVAMRLVPALALTAAVPVAYFATVRLVGQRAALAAAALTAVNPNLVWYSTDGRAYGLFVLVALLTVWAFGAALERPSGRRLALWALACLACVWTHYFGWFLVAFEAAALALLHRDRLAAVATAGAGIVAGFAPLLPMLTSQASSPRAEFIAHQSLSQRLEYTIRELAMGQNVPRTWLEGAGLAIASLALLAGAAILWRRGALSRALMLVALAAFLAPLAMGVLGIEDRFYQRNMIAVGAVSLAIAAPAMVRLRAVPLVLYAALAVLTSVWVATNWRYEQIDWRTAISRMDAIDPHAAFVTSPLSSAPVVGIYLHRPPSSTPVVTEHAWLAVEPTRGPHDRGFVPASLPAVPGFSLVREVDVHAFRLQLLSARRPTALDVRGAVMWGSH